ncbi:hypothetical protein BIZ37_09320 [Photobacterium sp. BZF1]|uniref:hypothetical protein n=1 Tax=Photobacterium sp. BZF1 TaxID=1904457 RepID=UPI0016537B10|nr:hypothetical protein [Photobacterium sp. BZF1]MBC7002754.1 hypothetical protein [Photobacterium sp. BZF1]
MSMNSRHGLRLMAAIFISSTFLGQSAYTANHSDDKDKLGTVQFATSFNSDSQPKLEKGLALLHHMAYATFMAPVPKYKIQNVIADTLLLSLRAFIQLLPKYWSI